MFLLGKRYSSISVGSAGFSLARAGAFICSGLGARTTDCRAGPEQNQTGSVFLGPGPEKNQSRSDCSPAWAGYYIWSVRAGSFNFRWICHRQDLKSFRGTGLN